MDDVSQMDANPDQDLLLRRAVCVELSQGCLDLNGAPDCLKRAPELDQESVTGHLDFSPIVLRQQGAHQPPLLIEKVDCISLTPLGERCETYHVGKHDGSQPSLARMLLR